MGLGLGGAVATALLVVCIAKISTEILISVFHLMQTAFALTRHAYQTEAPPDHLEVLFERTLSGN